jgi:hypothetical protein
MLICVSKQLTLIGVKIMSKSDLVRALIAASKTEGNTSPGDTLITQVMTECGFGRQLARTYVKNNWDKVEAFVAVPVEVVTEEVTMDLPSALDKLELKRQRDRDRKRAQRTAAKAAKEAEIV